MYLITVPPAVNNETASDKNITVIKDKSLVIDCPVTGIPLPEITWYKDDQPISSVIGANISVHDNGRRLEILSTQVPDDGVYQCVGTNDAGNTTRYFNVDVHGKYRWK